MSTILPRQKKESHEVSIQRLLSEAAKTEAGVKKNKVETIAPKPVDTIGTQKLARTVCAMFRQNSITINCMSMRMSMNTLLAMRRIPKLPITIAATERAACALSFARRVIVAIP